MKSLSRNSPFMHIAVLKGGLSQEREVSLVTGAAVSKALVELGHEVVEIDVGHDIAEVLSKTKPDIVFNALHGTYGEDGCIQGVLEFLQIPYTHSGVLASAIAMDKPLAKMIFESVGIKCPYGKVVSKNDLDNVVKRPYVIKPPAEGSSIGVIIVEEGDDLPDIDNKVLVEEYISGRELSVAVLNGKALGVVEICPKGGFYNYKSKYTKGKAEYIVPAPVEQSIYNDAMSLAEKADKILGCRGVSRSDFRLSEESVLYLLEINTHPGMTPLSLVPQIAEYAGIGFKELIDSLL